MAGIVQDVAWESTLPVFSGPLWDEVPEMPAFSFWEVVGDNFVPGNGIVPAVHPTAAAPSSNGNGDVPPVPPTATAPGANGDAHADL